MPITKNITDYTIKNTPAALAGKRTHIYDKSVPGLVLIVTDKGSKSFALMARFPKKPKNTTRRLLAVAGAIPLEKVREKAQKWNELIKQGIDPEDYERDERAKEAERQEATFGALVETFISKRVVGPNPDKPKMRQAHEMCRNLRVEFVNDKWETGEKGGKQATATRGAKRPGLKDRPITSITRRDIQRVIDDAVARGSVSMAHSLLAHVKMFFNWAISTEDYGLEASPCDRIRPKDIGEKPTGDRVLNEAEIVALWHATEKIPFPYGPLYKLLLLTGQRKAEISDAVWSELDTRERQLDIPKERMKNGLAHIVPLSDHAMSLIGQLPEFSDGDFIFTTTGGLKPVNGFSKSKRILDREMLAILKQKAADAGNDPEKVTLKPFTIHDLRRTCRTGLSKLGISATVAELVISHVQKGVAGIYDRHEFLAERHLALAAWARKVQTIVDPPPSKVILLAERR